MASAPKPMSQVAMLSLPGLGLTSLATVRCMYASTSSNASDGLQFIELPDMFMANMDKECHTAEGKETVFKDPEHDVVNDEFCIRSQPHATMLPPKNGSNCSNH
ncbi:predicted protein [Uncinocarpus reesii 1704]|uniref:Uncharacterized protein n=1 Tax=Uncinocarpus reesii (strain UAMH 1704) TaxID=336963 RepID=C4JLD5_UNCRE|nr:uncharacterized protein UREG_03643 [Uncinocarpus reesii 1704]EEP78797.1 predicted protein [Uncinocarpus reesii 1704]